MQPLEYTKLNDQSTKIFENNIKTKYNGHTYNIKNNVPKSEALVEKILKHEMYEHQQKLMSEKDPFFHALLLNKDDSHWEKQRQHYLEAEQWLQDNKEEIPSWEVAGPLNYAMSLNQMKEAITKKFKEIAFSGNILSEKSLNEKHKREAFYPTTGRGENNLTRIWGAQYLKSNLLDDKTLNAAEHFLIIDDLDQDIEVQVEHYEYPCLSVVKNGYVLSKKIDGTKSAEDYKFSQKLNALLFRDFGDPGNIIRDAENTGWIVDTELNSFNYPTLSKTPSILQDYLKKRFKFLAGENYSLSQTFKISLTGH